MGSSDRDDSRIVAIIGALAMGALPVVGLTAPSLVGIQDRDLDLTLALALGPLAIVAVGATAAALEASGRIRPWAVGVVLVPACLWSLALSALSPVFAPMFWGLLLPAGVYLWHGREPLGARPEVAEAREALARARGLGGWRRRIWLAQLPVVSQLVGWAVLVGLVAGTTLLLPAGAGALAGFAGAMNLGIVLLLVLALALPIVLVLGPALLGPLATRPARRAVGRILDGEPGRMPKSVRLSLVVLDVVILVTAVGTVLTILVGSLIPALASGTASAELALLAALLVPRVALAERAQRTGEPLWQAVPAVVREVWAAPGRLLVVLGLHAGVSVGVSLSLLAVAAAAVSAGVAVAWAAGASLPWWAGLALVVVGWLLVSPILARPLLFLALLRQTASLGATSGRVDP